MKKFMIFYLVICIFLFIGYVKGIIKFAQCDFEPSYKAEIVYGLGIVTGYNCVVGYMDFGK